MADTISHSTEGCLLALAPIIAWVRSKPLLWIVGAAGAVFGALPDILGAYGNYVDHDNWTMYRSAHFGELHDVLKYIPPYWLHLRIDRITHGLHHRWWVADERLWVEIALWLVNLAVILFFVWLRRRNRSRYAIKTP
jgi:hypothetical protein